MLEDDIAAIPVLDNHCHSLLRDAMRIDPLSFRRCFTESRDPAQLRDHLGTSLTYQLARTRLADMLACPDDEASLLARRSEFELHHYVGLLFGAERIAGLLVDTGYLSGESLRPHELRPILRGASCGLWTILRLETLAETLLPECASLDELVERFRDAIRGARSLGFVGLKSVIAYRSGLDVAAPDRAEASRAFQALAGTAAPIRLVDKQLLDFLLCKSLDEAARAGLPLQCHCGFGDTDLDLRLANPLHLRPILEDARFRTAPIVLLHCYPYVDEAAYLASVYSNVYLDLSLTVPFLGAGGVEAYRAALGLAPTSKILYGSDGFSIPELHWLGAAWGRRALAGALERWQSWGLSVTATLASAERILFRNAEKLYDIRAVGESVAPFN